MSYAPTAPKVGFAKKTILVAVTAIIAAVGFVVSIRPASAEVCPTDGYMQIDLPEAALQKMLPTGHTSEGAFQATWSGSELVITYPGGPTGDCDANGMNPWEAEAIAFGAYLATSVLVGFAITTLAPEFEPFVFSVSNTVASGVKEYIKQGLENNDWGWQSVASALVASLEAVVAGATLRILWPDVDSAINEAVLKVVKSNGTGWWSFLAPNLGPLVGEVELVATEVGRILGSTTA